MAPELQIIKAQSKCLLIISIKKKITNLFTNFTK